MPIAGQRWRSLAACREWPTEWWWWPPESEAAEATARDVCAICPVRDECLADALERREADGIWGGLSPPERAALVRRRRREERDRAG
jgi:WhiB family transcriptional regulator, redox-sensing transcriptional regulator